VNFQKSASALRAKLTPVDHVAADCVTGLFIQHAISPTTAVGAFPPVRGFARTRHSCWLIGHAASPCGDSIKKVAINNATAMHPFDNHSIGPLGA